MAEPAIGDWINDKEWKLLPGLVEAIDAGGTRARVAWLAFDVATSSGRIIKETGFDLEADTWKVIDKKKTVMFEILRQKVIENEAAGGGND